MNKIFKEVEEILKNAQIEEYKQEAKMIILELSGEKLEDILIKEEINNKEKILEIANLRANSKKPLQHLLGYSYFMNEKYLVNENVLIPRDETEILVNCAFNEIKNKKDKLTILDIGLGSGCISCALAKKLKDKDIEILGVDISLEALETALENISKLDLVRKVIVRKSDLFSKIRPFEKFDLIISNPPYIPIKEKVSLQEEVKFEPESALFAQDNEGIEFYQKIIQEAPKFLKNEGILAFELGANQSELVKNLLIKDFKDIKIIKDLAQIDRVILAKLK